MILSTEGCQDSEGIVIKLSLSHCLPQTVAICKGPVLKNSISICFLSELPQAILPN